jgi:O-antigen/teichoic acid export membrane protein
MADHSSPMSSTTDEAPVGAVRAADGATSNRPTVLGSDSAALKGSLLFLVGRVLSMGLSLLAQVLIVRTLSKDDFGSFAYALALAALIQSFLALGLDRSDTYFLTKFDEAHDPGRVKGLLVVELSVTAASGLVALGVLAVLAGRVIDGVPPSVLLLIAAMAPLMAADALVLNAFAVFAKPRAIFLRRYVLDPVLRLAVVAVLVLTGMRLVPLAAGYLIAAGIGTGIYLVLLLRLMRRVLARGGGGAGVRFTWPGAEVFRYAAPLLFGAVMYAGMSSIPTLALKSLGSTAEVAELRAVQPVAALILVVPTVFASLFLPRAARLFRRREDVELAQHYWATAVWVAVLAFPAVVLFTAFAPTVTATLFGARYLDAARPLAIMAVAFYLNAALGLNGSLLQVTGQVRRLTVANVVGLVVAGVASLVLIPPFGADGAAWSVAAALVVPQVMKQLSLRKTAVRSVHPAAIRLWVSGSGLLVLAFAVDRLGLRNGVAAVATTVICWAVLLMVMRRELMASNVLPLGQRRRTPAPGVPGPPDPGGASEGPAATADLPGTWQCLDWRFLGADPTLGAVRCIDTRPVVLSALAALGEHTVDARGRESDTATVDTVIVSGACCTLPTLAAIRSSLRPGGRIVVEISSAPPGAGVRARLRRWRYWRAHLERAGFTLEGSYVALPNVNRTSALIQLDQRIALIAALRRQPVQLVKRVAAWAATVAIRLGQTELVCQQGVILARADSDRAVEIGR